jgi:suppressor of G2 allele of SKP1
MDFSSLLKDKVDYMLIGSQHFFNQCFILAETNFTKAINENPRNTQAIILKSLSFISQSKYKDALEALDLAERNNDRLYEVFYNKGKCHFYLGDYGSAYEHFLKALSVSQLNEQRENVDVWMSKIKTELPKEVLNKLTPTTTSEVSFNVSWDQDNKYLFLTLESNKEINKEDLNVVITQRTIQIYHLKKIAYNLTLSNSISNADSQFTVEPNSINFRLKKQVDDFNWVNIDKSKDDTDTFRQSYPTSSKVKKDWNKIEQDIDKQLKAEPEDGPYSLFKEIFARGDEDTRRAMVKSLQTSGGTVLSTNWSEVKEKDYEGKDRPEPPKGQEWKKPEY